MEVPLGLGGLAPVAEHDPQDSQGARLAGAVAHFAMQAQGLLSRREGLARLMLIKIRNRQAAQAVGLLQPVGRLAAKGDGLGRGRLGGREIAQALAAQDQ